MLNLRGGVRELLDPRLSRNLDGILSTSMNSIIVIRVIVNTAIMAIEQ